MSAPLIRVEGAKQLRKTLRKAGDDLQDMRAVHTGVARYVAAHATGQTPRRSGRLAGSVRGSGAKTHATIRAGRAAIPYAGPIHYGWPARGIRANPFLTDTAQNTEAAWVGMYSQGVDDILDKVEGV